MNTVYGILRNEKYTGIYRIGEDVLENMYPKIIDTDLFESVKAKLEKNKYGKNSIEMPYLLRRKIKCGYCGKSMIGECGTARNGETKRYYINVRAKNILTIAKRCRSEKRNSKNAS